MKRQTLYKILIGIAASGLAIMPCPFILKQVKKCLNLEEEITTHNLLKKIHMKSIAGFSPSAQEILVFGVGGLGISIAPIDHPKIFTPLPFNTIAEGVSWSWNPDYLIFSNDLNGDENTRVHSYNLKTHEVLPLSPLGARSYLLGSSRLLPNEILIATNDRKPMWHDIYRVNIKTGQKTLVELNNQFASFVADKHLKLRLAKKENSQGYQEIWFKTPQNTWELLFSYSQDAGCSGFHVQDDILYFLDHRSSNLCQLRSLDLKTKKEQILFEPTPQQGEITYYQVNALTGKPIALVTEYHVPEWHVLDPLYKPGFDFLKSLENGIFGIVEFDQNYQKCLIKFIFETTAKYYIFDFKNLKATYLFSASDTLEAYAHKFAKTYPTTIPARDGLKLPSYLTLPLESDPKKCGLPKKPLPLILFVHGGPWSRDYWGFDATVQKFAADGYAVLQVNYRGSSGFGKDFLNAGFKEWGGKVIGDLVDAVQWAIKEKIADPKRVAILGASYGGYAALAALAFAPTVFTCGVDIVGPSNLISFLETIPPYWKTELKQFYHRVGDPTTPEGAALLKAQSPLFHADKIERPLLIIHGANDPRVKQSEADQIVAQLKKKKTPVTYLLFPDEGHGIQFPANNSAQRAAIDGFLAAYLGGTPPKITSEFEGSAGKFVTGKEFLKGLPKWVE